MEKDKKLKKDHTDSLDSHIEGNYEIPVGRSSNHRFNWDNIVRYGSIIGLGATVGGGIGLNIWEHGGSRSDFLSYMVYGALIGGAAALTLTFNNNKNGRGQDYWRR